jgi:hypothetical protein
VQDAQFPGSIEGASEVRGADFVQTVVTRRAVGASVDLGASVTFSYTPVDGGPFERVRILDGPVTLVGGPPGDWRLIDFTRDGVPMTDGIQLFKDERRRDGRVTVILDSLFMFTPNWQFNVIVENRTGSEIRIDPATTDLFVRRPGKGFHEVQGATAQGLEAIPPASSVQSMVSYPLQGSADGRVLHLSFSQGNRSFAFDFPLQDIVTAVPPPPPTDAAEARAG